MGVRRVHDPDRTWYLARAESVRPAVILTLNGARREVRAFDEDGTLIDAYDSPPDGVAIQRARQPPEACGMPAQMTALRDIVAGAGAWELLGARQAGNTWREVHRVEGRYVVKSFTIPLAATHYRRPWVREHEALTRAPAGCAPESLGWFEETRDGQRLIRFGRTYLSGAVLDVFTETHVEPVARLLARLHRHGIVTDDANPRNFLIALDGRMLVIDLGRAHWGRPDRWPFHWWVGRELAKVRRRGFQWRDPPWQVFRDRYFREQAFSPAAAAAVRASAGLTTALRQVRMVLQGRSPWT